MFYLRYLFSELRRRKGRTIVTALGLAVGVGLVVTVTALSNGLDEAQDKVLKPLTGVGTDMSVTRPLRASGSGSNQNFQPGPGGPGGLSEKEQRQLRRENGGGRVGLSNLGDPGEKFSRDNFMTTQLSFPESEVKTISALNGVEDAAPALTLNAIHISGTVPRNSGSGGGLGGPGGGGGGPGGPPNNIDLQQKSVSGVDVSKPALGLVTPGQVRSGKYFGRGRYEAILSESYSQRQKLSVGDEITLGKKTFEVVGIAKPPLGGQSSDIYVPLATLQKLSDREGRVNVVQVRATDSGEVETVSNEIEDSFSGAQVTTSKDLADRVSGSLVDAKNLSSKLGAALAIVALAAAFLIATLLTLSSVNKRTRELGTLKAIGWRSRLVVRQVTGESVVQGLLGGVLGALIGIGGAALVAAFAPTLQASVAQSAQAGVPGPFGQGDVVSGSSSITLGAPIDPSLIVLAIGLAVLGGLIAGSIGGARAARLRPAQALRSVE